MGKIFALPRNDEVDLVPKSGWKIIFRKKGQLGTLLSFNINHFVLQFSTLRNKYEQRTITMMGHIQEFLFRGLTITTV